MSEVREHPDAVADAGGQVKRGRRRLELAGLEVFDAPERATGGPGLELHAGARLDVDDVEDLRDELDRFLDERGRR